MPSRRRLIAAPLALAGLAAIGAAGYLWFTGAQAAPPPLSAAEMERLYAEPLPPPAGAVRGFHIGHSLVGRDMPAMLAQLAGGDYAYESQLGWGTTMREHWGPNDRINGFETENNHPRYRSASEAVDSGDYGVLVLTEMVEIRDAMAYFESWNYLSRWAERARAANPEIRVYFYETWHPTDDPEGWLNRLDADLNRYWIDGILRPALTESEGTYPIHVIPGGQVMAAFVRAVEARGGLPDVSGVDDVMADKIHFNDLGAYLIALTHYAVIFGRSPVGLPHELMRADGSPAVAPSPETAALMQNVVWDVVTSMPMTGVAGAENASFGVGG
jgi:hypothetical protein